MLRTKCKVRNFTKKIFFSVTFEISTLCVRWLLRDISVTFLLISRSRYEPYKERYVQSVFLFQLSKFRGFTNTLLYFCTCFLFKVFLMYVLFMSGQINPLNFLSEFELHKLLMQLPASGLAYSKVEVAQN